MRLLALTVLSVALLLIPAATASTGEHLNVLILLVNYQDTQPLVDTPAQAKTNFDSLVGSYYQGQSYNQMTMTTAAAGWYQIPYSVNGPCDQPGWATAAKSDASNAGVDVLAYDHFIYVLSGGVSSCGGIAFGGGSFSLGEEFGGPNVVTDYGVGRHEFGHAIGLNHTDELGPVGGSADDRLPAAQLVQLNWLDAPQAASGTYALTSVEQLTGLRALQIPRGDGTRLVVEYRSGQGVYVEADSGPFTYVYWLDANPCNGMLLEPNQYFYDATGRILLSLGTSSSALTVTLNADPPPPPVCPPPPPPPPPVCHGHHCTGKH